MTFWRRQNYGDNKKTVVVVGRGWVVGRREINNQRAEEQGSENTLYDTVKMDNVIIHSSKPTECTSPRVNPKVNCGLWVIMICQCRFILGKKCTIPVNDVDSGEAMHVLGGRRHRGNLRTSLSILLSM